MSEKDLNELEGRIIDLKGQTSIISSERRAAAIRGDEKAVFDARVKLVEQAIENCGLLTSYVSLLVPTLAARFSEQQKDIKIEMEKIKMLNNESALHEWVKTSLVPFLRQSEQVAYVAATSSRSAKEGQPIQFNWARKGY